MIITQKQQQEGLQFHSQIIKRAWKDEEFMRNLISEPKKSIEELLGQPLKISHGVEIKVENQTDTSKVFLNIPKKIDIENFELTDEQLELVSGGEWGIIIALAIIAVVGFTDGINDMK